MSLGFTESRSHNRSQARDFPMIGGRGRRKCTNDSRIYNTRADWGVIRRISLTFKRAALRARFYGIRGSLLVYSYGVDSMHARVYIWESGGMTWLSAEDLSVVLD